MLQPGSAAPEIEIADSATGNFTLSEARKRGAVMVVFFKVSCPTCQFTMPFLERLASGRNGDAPQLIAISQDNAADTGKFRQRFGLSFPMLIDPGPSYAASKAYGITHVPSVFLVEADGLISLSFDGFEKRGLEELARRFGAKIFSFCDFVPAHRPG